MSRSYKKNLFYTSSGSGYRRWAKQQANRTIRHAKDVPNGKVYRKYYDSWEICDYRSMYNPRPRTYNWGGKIRIVEPDPLWKARMK